MGDVTGNENNVFGRSPVPPVYVERFPSVMNVRFIEGVKTTDEPKK